MMSVRDATMSFIPGKQELDRWRVDVGLREANMRNVI